MNKLLQIVFMSIPILIVFMMLVGCSQLEEIQKQQQQLTCEPVEANGCIGWLGSKPIMLEQEL